MFQVYFQGLTKLMLTKIPHFKEVIISSFSCNECSYENSEIQSGGRIQVKGHKLELTIKTKKVSRLFNKLKDIFSIVL